MPGNEVGKILDAYHPLHKGLSQVAYLAHGRGNKSCYNAEPQRQRGYKVEEKIINQYSGYDGGEGAAYASFNSLVGADRWGHLVLAEKHSAKEGKTVAHPGGQAGKYKRLHPNIAYTDAHYYCKEKTGITETGQGEKRALAAHFLVNDAGKQGKIQAEDKHGDIYQHVCFKENAEGMKHKISEHHPESAGRIKLFHVLAIFIGAQSTRYSKEDDAAYRRQKDTGKSDHQHPISCSGENQGQVF